MLDYAPEGPFDVQPAEPAGFWAVAWPDEGLPDDGQLLRLVAASRESARLSMAKQAAARRPAPSFFEPERLSGFCATG